MKKEIKVFIKELPPSVNHLYGRTRFGGTYKTKVAKDWGEYVAWEIRSAVGTELERIQVALDVYFPDNRKRDLDNMMKLVSDAIVDSGIVKDDNWKIVSWKSICGFLDKENPRIEITIVDCSPSLAGEK